MTDGRTGRATGVLLMGYGSPSGPEDLPGYLREVMGRAPPDSVVREYEHRYEGIGWSPQMRILRALREKLEVRLARESESWPVYLGTKHWEPHIAEAIRRASSDGIDRLIAVPLSPYASRWILEPYERAIAEGRRRAARPLQVELRTGWHLEPAWVRYWSEAIAASLSEAPDETLVLLSAHSLPERMRLRGDPYPELVQATAHRIAELAGLDPWEFTYQSAGNTTEAWLGPDVTERILEGRDRGRPDQLLAPIGFVFDHLEVLYDLDVVVRAFAESHGVRYRRVPMPNDDDRLVAALASVARGATPPAPPSS